MKLSALIRTGGPLLLAPLSLVLHYTDTVPSVWIFFILAALAVLADWVCRGTEQVAKYAGATIGSLLNVSFGSAAELTLGLFVLASAQTRIVQAQIAVSIIGTTLLFLGICVLVGGSRRGRQKFNPEQVGLLSTLLLLVAIPSTSPNVPSYPVRTSS
jgi:Ca2+:H+ antiporter